jgi:hypothetical protein
MTYFFPKHSTPLIPAHGGYRELKSFQQAELVYDSTVKFCDRFIDKRSRTHDQMVQAARVYVRILRRAAKPPAPQKNLS